MSTISSKDQGLAKIQKLVDAFQRNLSQYKQATFNEANVRNQFIDPFFEALGWDVYNKSGAAEAYKDVIHEDAIKVGHGTKAPDYCFRIGSSKIFFVEAKKPYENIYSNPKHAFQLRRYGWSGKLNISILTDFEELAIYDCRIRPRLGDPVHRARVKYYKFTEYIEKFDELRDLFGREAVLQGSLERFARDELKVKGTTPVDDEFLKEIELWRESLARNIALRNDWLDVYQLNFAVQRTIDRIIFLRICEDRGVEIYGKLQSICNGEGLYPRLLELFYRAEERYNSGLFHFEEEKGQTEYPDTITHLIAIDDSVLKQVLANLYYPDSPYEFSMISADILGHVYEQFLGKVIRLTAGHQAKIEEKPEVKKAGGVFYTPRYIVDYIVKQTVGKLCDGKTPRQVKNLKIVDPIPPAVAALSSLALINT